MDDLMAEMERAVSLHLRGHASEALEIGRTQLDRTRGTPHAAWAHRHVAEFHHAVGDYPAARKLAREAGALARAMRHPEEILASSLVLLACDLYEGMLVEVARQLHDILELAPGQPTPMYFMGQIMVLTGNFAEALELFEETLGIVDDRAAPGAHPLLDLFRANVLIAIAKAQLLAGQPREARAVLPRALELELPTLVPAVMAGSLLGLAEVLSREPAAGLARLEQAVTQARAVAGNLLGHTLALAGIALKALGRSDAAATRLSQAVDLFIHPLERQETLLALGEIATLQGRAAEAERLYRAAILPTSETHFGRKAIAALHAMVGLRPLNRTGNLG